MNSFCISFTTISTFVSHARCLGGAVLVAWPRVYVNEYHSFTFIIGFSTTNYFRKTCVQA